IPRYLNDGSIRTKSEETSSIEHQWKSSDALGNVSDSRRMVGPLLVDVFQAMQHVLYQVGRQHMAVVCHLNTPSTCTAPRWGARTRSVPCSEAAIPIRDTSEPNTSSPW